MSRPNEVRPERGAGQANHGDAVTSKGSTADERPRQVRWLIFVLACAVSWLLYLQRYAWGVIKPEIKEEYPGPDRRRIWAISIRSSP